jgi:dihydroxy-acid dehydratase
VPGRANWESEPREGSGSIPLNRVVDAVVRGVSMAGGTPMVFPSIGICDGLAMGHEGMKYVFSSRELIADSVEVMAMAQPFDALVLVTNCDKITPGMLMAALHLNVPAVVLSGGPMQAGRWRGQETDLTTVTEAVGAVSAGEMTEEDLADLEEHCCPGCGACAGMFTANSMNCMAEALGAWVAGQWDHTGRECGKGQPGTPWRGGQAGGCGSRHAPETRCCVRL